MGLVMTELRAQIIQASFATVHMLPTADQECPICRMELSDPVKLPMCTHVFCRSCLDAWMVGGLHRDCPLCRRQLNIAWAQCPAAVRSTLLGKMNLAREMTVILSEMQGGADLAAPGAMALTVKIRDTTGRYLQVQDLYDGLTSLREYLMTDAPLVPAKLVTIHFDDLLAPLTVAGLVLPTLQAGVGSEFKYADFDGWFDIVASLHHLLKNMESQRFDGATLAARLLSRLENFLGRKDVAGRRPLRAQIAKKTGLAPLTVVLVDAVAAIAIGKHHQARFGKGADATGSRSTQAKMVPTAFDFY